MKVKELREFDNAQLNKRITELKDEALKLRFKAVSTRIDNNARFGNIRREIARIATIMREREIQNAK